MQGFTAMSLPLILVVPLVVGARRIVLFGWAALEAFRYHRLQRRRLALGHAAPVAAAQILLWGVAALAMMVFTATVVVSVFVEHRHPLDVPAALWLITSGTLTASAAMWCAFFPPAALRRWVAPTPA